MSQHPHRVRRVQAFLQIASEELEAARRLHVDLPRQATYFLQQTTEKLVRAVIEANDRGAGPTHNIAALTDLLAPDHELRAYFLEQDELSAAATSGRYPTSSGAIRVHDEPDELSLRIQQVEALFALVRAYLNKKHLG